MEKGKVLILLPEAERKAGIEHLNTKGWDIHSLVDPNFTDPVGKNPEFSAVEYINRAVGYVRENGIQGVTGTHDLACLLAAAVNNKTGLKGPSFKSQFYCVHKYYFRKLYGSPFEDYWMADVDTDLSVDENAARVVSYPLRMKAVVGYDSSDQITVRNREEFEKAFTWFQQKSLKQTLGWINKFLFDELNDHEITGDSWEKMPLILMEHFFEGYKQVDYVAAISGEGQLVTYDIGVVGRIEGLNMGLFPLNYSPEQVKGVVENGLREAQRLVDQGFVASGMDVEGFLNEECSRMHVMEVNGRYTTDELHFEDFIAPGCDILEHFLMSSLGYLPTTVPHELPGKKWTLNYNVETPKRGVVRELIDFQYYQKLKEEGSCYEIPLLQDQEVPEKMYGNDGGQAILTRILLRADSSEQVIATAKETITKLFL